MNKIQLEATLQLAEIDCENNPTPVNKNRVAQAKAAFDAFLKAQEEPATEAEKPLKPAAPKKAPAPKKEKVVTVVPDATADTADASDEETDTDTDPTAETAASADRDTQAEETEEKKTQE